MAPLLRLSPADAGLSATGVCLGEIHGVQPRGCGVVALFRMSGFAASGSAPRGQDQVGCLDGCLRNDGLSPVVGGVGIPFPGWRLSGLGLPPGRWGLPGGNQSNGSAPRWAGFSGNICRCRDQSRVLRDQAGSFQGKGWRPGAQPRGLRGWMGGVQPGFRFWIVEPRFGRGGSPQLILKQRSSGSAPRSGGVRHSSRSVWVRPRGQLGRDVPVYPGAEERNYRFSPALAGLRGGWAAALTLCIWGNPAWAGFKSWQ